MRPDKAHVSSYRNLLPSTAPVREISGIDVGDRKMDAHCCCSSSGSRKTYKQLVKHLPFWATGTTVKSSDVRGLGIECLSWKSSTDARNDISAPVAHGRAKPLPTSSWGLVRNPQSSVWHPITVASASVTGNPCHDNLGKGFMRLIDGVQLRWHKQNNALKMPRRCYQKWFKNDPTTCHYRFCWKQTVWKQSINLYVYIYINLKTI